jgi:hypothetical protein
LARIKKGGKIESSPASNEYRCREKAKGISEQEEKVSFRSKQYKNFTSSCPLPNILVNPIPTIKNRLSKTNPGNKSL